MKNTIPQKNPCVVFATQKNPGVFHRPKKILICEWGPWDVLANSVLLKAYSIDRIQEYE